MSCAQKHRPARTVLVGFSIRSCLAGVFILAVAAQTFAGESLEQTIAYLTDYVAKSKTTFIRNGAEHTPAEAAAHIQAKYRHFKGEIKTPEDFIRLSASKSLLTGQPYLVRTADGKETRLDVWLTNALKEHRANRDE